MFRIINLLLAFSMVAGMPVFAAANEKDKIRIICQRYDGGEPQDALLVLEMLDPDVMPAEQFTTAFRPTEWIDFSLKSVEYDSSIPLVLIDDASELEQIAEKATASDRLVTYTKRDGTKVALNFEGRAINDGSNIIFQHFGNHQVEFKIFPDDVMASLIIDQQHPYGYKCKEFLIVR